jgi:TPR repeat protein
LACRPAEGAVTVIAFATVSAHTGRVDDRSREEAVSELLDAALAMWEKGDLDAAERFDRRAYELGDPRAAYNLGLIMAARGRTKDAEAYYREAAEAGLADAAWNLACVLRDRDRTDPEWEHWCRIAAQGGDVAAASQLGVVLAQRGQIVEARLCLAAAVREGDENAQRNLEILDRFFPDV